MKCNSCGRFTENEVIIFYRKTKQSDWTKLNSPKLFAHDISCALDIAKVKAKETRMLTGYKFINIDLTPIMELS